MFFKIILYFNLVLNIFCLDIVDENVIQTTSGTVKGHTIRVLNQSIVQFLGIPYAEPPIGDLRFAKPKPIERPHKGIIDATKPKYSCLQPKKSDLSLNQSEDCLLLNIWSPKIENNTTTQLKPVMFWIYGGGLNIGSIDQKKYNGSVLATHQIVFVSVNYRLGQLGFLYGGEESAPGNVGLYDQVHALKWVRDNIHLFGGDKNQITIFGESAGSWSVSAHILSPISKGLYKRAIMQSCAHMYNKDRPLITKEEALIAAKITAKQLNCTDDKLWLECLRKVDGKQLIPTRYTGQETFPVDGTEFLPLTAQKAFSQMKFNKDMDLIAGVTRDEGTYIVPGLFDRNYTHKEFVEFFKLLDSVFHDLNLKNITEYYLNNTNEHDTFSYKWQIFQFFGDLAAKCPTYLFAKLYAQHSSPETNVYFYELTHSTRGPVFESEYGITHATDLAFVFGQILFDSNITEEDKEFSKEVMKLWTNFAKYGKPDNNWPKLINTKTEGYVTQIKDLNPKNLNKYLTDLYKKNCDQFWKNYF